MPEETAVIESPLDVETPEIESEPSVEEAAPVAESESSTEAKTDDRQFAGKMRELHKQLSASQDPADQRAAKQLKGLFFADKALKEEFPGGLAEIRALKEQVGKFGAPEEIEAAKEAAATLDEIDSKWVAGDPAFIDELVQLNLESFKKLAPVAIQKFSQIDPEGYQRVMSGIVSNTLISSRMDTQLVLLSDAIESGNKEKALGLIKGIEDWMGKLDETSKAPPKVAENKPDEFAERERQLAEREATIFNQSLVGEFNSWRDSQIKTELSKLRPGGAKGISSERYEIFSDRVAREVSRMTDPDFAAKFNSLWAQKDKDGCLKLTKSQTEKHLAKAVAKTYAILFGTSKPKPAAAAPQNGNGKPAAPGWIKISQRPKPEEINRDRGATSDDMILSGRAILRDGRRVMWDR